MSERAGHSIQVTEKEVSNYIQLRDIIKLTDTVESSTSSCILEQKTSMPQHAVVTMNQHIVT